MSDYKMRNLDDIENTEEEENNSDLGEKSGLFDGFSSSRTFFWKTAAASNVKNNKNNIINLNSDEWKKLKSRGFKNENGEFNNIQTSLIDFWTNKQVLVLLIFGFIQFVMIAYLIFIKGNNNYLLFSNLNLGFNIDAYRFASYIFSVNIFVILIALSLIYFGSKISKIKVIVSGFKIVKSFSILQLYLYDLLIGIFIILLPFNINLLSNDTMISILLSAILIVFVFFLNVYFLAIISFSDNSIKALYTLNREIPEPTKIKTFLYIILIIVTAFSLFVSVELIDYVISETGVDFVGFIQTIGIIDLLYSIILITTLILGIITINHYVKKQYRINI